MQQSKKCFFRNILADFDDYKWIPAYKCTTSDEPSTIIWQKRTNIICRKDFPFAGSVYDCLTDDYTSQNVDVIPLIPIKPDDVLKHLNNLVDADASEYCLHEVYKYIGMSLLLQ